LFDEYYTLMRLLQNQLSELINVDMSLRIKHPTQTKEMQDYQCVTRVDPESSCPDVVVYHKLENMVSKLYGTVWRLTGK